MASLNILHISDAHIQKKDILEIKEIVQKLIDDIKRVQTEKDIKIDRIIKSYLFINYINLLSLQSHIISLHITSSASSSASS